MHFSNLTVGLSILKSFLEEDNINNALKETGQRIVSDDIDVNQLYSNISLYIFMFICLFLGCQYKLQRNIFELRFSFFILIIPK